MLVLNTIIFIIWFMKHIGMCLSLAENGEWL